MAELHYQIKSESPVVADLMFWSIVGQESLSRPSHYELTVLSKLDNIQAKDILGFPFNLTIEFQDEDETTRERHCQGHAVRFTRAGTRGRLFAYRLSLRSWFWLLTKRQNSRILQDSKVLQIFDAVVDDGPLKAFKKHKTDKVIGTHEPRRYCTQYQESDYDFLSRLMEDEGIHYWFDAHEAPGTMYLADASDVAHPKLPVTGTLNFVASGVGEARHNELWHWREARALESGEYASRDSDFKAIGKQLKADKADPDTHELADLEVFEFPGGYDRNADTEDRARLRMEELATRRRAHWGLTRWPDVAPGLTFTLENHPLGEPAADHLIAACTLVAVHAGYEGEDVGSADLEDAECTRLLRTLALEDPLNAKWSEALGEQLEQVPARRGNCAFLITTYPADQPWRAQRRTPRVVMPGPQSALVVGPDGDEIHADEFGRVKVHFHWDRYDKRNEKSTCWIRVSQPWAGKGWGGYFVPRIGQEVIVDFLNGDPDRPLIMGRVYNDEQPIPYDSPTQSGFRTRSTPGGSAANCNEIMFEDKKGEEMISIHAELDMSRSVERDDSTTVDRDQSLTVRRDQTSHVDRDRKSTVTRNDTNMVVVDQKNTVKGKQNNQVVGDRLSFVDANDSLTVGGKSTVDVVGARTTSYRAGESHTVVGNQTISVTGKVTYKAAEMSFEAAHIDWMVTGANSKYITVPTGPLHLMANKIKLMSNTGIEMLAVGNIDQTALGSNTTILGPNTSGYIGNNSEANLGTTRSTFMGLSIDNAISLAMSNFGGVAIENTLGVKLINCVAPEIKSISTADMTLTPFMTVTPGGGGGAVTAGLVAGALGAVAGAGSAFVDLLATLTQYADAATQLENAATDARAADLPGLADRLDAMAVRTRAVRQEGVSMVAGAGNPTAQLIVDWLSSGSSGGDDMPVNADGTPASPGSGSGGGSS